MVPGQARTCPAMGQGTAKEKNQQQGHSLGYCCPNPASDKAPGTTQLLTSSNPQAGL